MTSHVPAKVMNTIKPITLADEQPPAPLPPLQAGFDPPPEGSYLTYTFESQPLFYEIEILMETIFWWEYIFGAFKMCIENKTAHDYLPETRVRENQAPNATEAIPPIALTRKTWPKDLATSIVC